MQGVSVVKACQVGAVRTLGNAEFASNGNCKLMEVEFASAALRQLR